MYNGDENLALSKTFYFFATLECCKRGLGLFPKVNKVI